jgi:hypothetical protein
MPRNIRPALVVFGLLSFLGPAHGQESPKKYGPKATRLYEAREYIREAEAPDYWALMPYYRAQPNDAACSLAVAAMLMNGLRVRETLPADEPLITPENLLEKLNDPLWAKAVGKGGEGVSLDELAEILRKSLAAYGLNNLRVEAVPIEKASPEELARVRKVLAQNEESDRDFLIANFLQKTFTGDPEGDVGHFAPIAAYDARRSRVLIFDPDRQWYEPYWVSEQTLLEGMATKDSESKRSRGYLWVRGKNDQ